MSVVAITEKHVEALSVAMALAPGVYVRNRMFDFFAHAGVQRARMRASILRGLVQELPRATALTVSSEGGRGGEPVWVLRFRIEAIRLVRVVELSSTELAALRTLAARSGVTALAAGHEDRTLVDAALARLMELEALGGSRVPDPRLRVRARP